MKWYVAVLCGCLLCACVKNRQVTEAASPNPSPVVHAETVVPTSPGHRRGKTISPVKSSGEMAKDGAVFRLLVNGNAVATAFAVATANPKWSGFTVLVTAAHALAGVSNDSSSSLSLEGPEKKPIPVVRHSVSKDMDVAVLFVKTSLPVLAVGGPPVRGVACHSENYSFFPPLTHRPIILSRGYVMQVEKDDIWAFLMPFAQGGSGAALMVDGAAVGLVNIKVLDENKNPTGIVHAINIKSVIRFVDSLS